MAWVLGVPLAFGVFGWVMMNIVDARVYAAIQDEEQKLRAMGIRAVPFRQEEDAAPEIRRLASLLVKKKIATVDSQGVLNGGTESLPDAEIRRSLNEISHKVYIGAGGVSEDAKFKFDSQLAIVEYAISGSLGAASREKDLTLFKELADLADRIIVELALGMREPDFPFAGALSDQPYGLNLTWYHGIPPQGITPWLRQRLEHFDTERLFLAHESGNLLRMRALLRGKSKRYPPSGIKDQVERFVERQGIFRRLGELELLRAFREINAARWSDIKRIGKYGGIEREIWDRLNAGSWPAFCVGQEIFGGMNDLELSGSLEAERRAHLIQLDLGVQYLTIDSPMPTWSERYLIDPESGKPVKLVITEHDGRSVKYRLTGIGSTVIQEFGFFKPLK